MMPDDANDDVLQACDGCDADGPDNCLKCAEGYTLKNNFCVTDKTANQGKYPTDIRVVSSWFHFTYLFDLWVKGHYSHTVALLMTR